MLIPFLCLGGAVAGSYALFPSTWYKLRHRLRRERGLAAGTLYLTFDDGPNPEHTARLLDLLARYGVKASFFVVGDFAQAHPELIRRMVQEGHLVGFHSAHHRSAYLMTPRQTRWDFTGGLAALARLGVTPLYFRPPWGVVNWASLRLVRRYRLQPVFWDVMAQDWKANITAEEIVRRLRRRTRPGDILCLHDGRGAPGAPARTIAALEILLPPWLAQGFRFATLECYG